MKILIAGDFCENDRVRTLIAQGDYEAVFGEVRPIVESADYAIVNFEMPVVTGEGKPIKKCGPALRGSKQAIDAIRYAGFDCCTLANNHTLDQGETCGLETKALIEQAGMDTVGFGKDEADAAKTLYKKIGNKTLAVINCCEHEFSVATKETAGTNGLNPVRQYRSIQEARQKADYVLVIVHGGIEHYNLPTVRMQETYRFFIEAGADAVVNHHQHCFSGYEIYQGKPIIYGLGNFVFDVSDGRDLPWNKGYLLELEQTDDECAYKLFHYEQCNADAKVRILKEPERSLQDAEVSKLNSIIASETKLRSAEEARYEKKSLNARFAIEPYSRSITTRLFIRGLLPSAMSEQKKLQLMNWIECESHRDHLLYVLHNIK